MAQKKQLILEQITLLRAGAKGISVGKTEEGKTVLVKDGIPGDIVDVRVYKKKKQYFEGKAVHFHQLSPHRTEPKCIHFGLCGGCKWQNMNYDAQLSFKQEEVENNLRRIGGFTDLEVSNILGSEESYYYRNKMEYSFSNARWLTEEEIANNESIENKNALGFHIPGQWSKVLDLKECHLQPIHLNEIRLEAKRYADENDLEYFDLVNQRGFLRTFMIRTSSLGQVMILVQFFKEDLEKRKAFLEHLRSKFPEITSLLYAINPKGNDSLYDLDIEVHSGQDHIMEEMEGLQFKIGPKSFYQTNAKQAYELYKFTRDFAQLTGEELVYDLYTGTGTIAQFVAKNAKKVIGIESVPEAIEAAKENAKRNKIENCDFHCGDMKEILNTEFIAQNGTPDVIITDPPRDGMHKKVIENILLMAPKRIVYVSCNSATQARDLELMKEEYRIVKVQPVDMFPQTHHVENIVLLDRKPCLLEKNN